MMRPIASQRAVGQGTAQAGTHVARLATVVRRAPAVACCCPRVTSAAATGSSSAAAAVAAAWDGGATGLCAAAIRQRRATPCTVAGAAAAPGAPTADDDVEEEPYLGPAGDIVSALEALSYTRTFTDMCIFMENNSHLFRGPEAAAVVLQAANVSERAAQRQMAAAMAVAERRAVDLAAAGDTEGGMAREVLVAAMGEAAGASGRAAEAAAGAGGAGSGGDGGDGDEQTTVLDELDAADQLLGWVTPQLRGHIKRFPPDVVSALLSALAQLQQYDKRLMELAAESVKSDPRLWLQRASSPSAPSPEAAMYGEGGGGGAAARADPWFTLVSLAGAFARLGHYDRDLMSTIAQLAVELMPEVSERAEAEDAAIVAAAAAAAQEEGNSAAAAAAAAAGLPGRRVTDTVVALVTSFLELNHLDPELMQVAGEHLAAFTHTLDRCALADVLLAYATFNARNPAFYSILLRRMAEGVDAGELSPRGAGSLYRACVLISAMGDVPELLPRTAPSSAAVAAAAEGPGNAAAASAATDAQSADAAAARVGDALAQLFRGCLEAFPLSAMHAAPLGRPNPEQLEQAEAVPELLEAWEATGLLTVPQILVTLEQLAVEPLPPDQLTSYGTDGGGGDDAAAAARVVGGEDAVAWVPPDALLLYDESGSGTGSGTRIAVKALDETLHSCRNVGQDPDSEPDRPGPRYGVSGARGGAEATGADEPLLSGRRRRRQLVRLRGPALSELRCLQAWGWQVLVVPVGLWGEMDAGERRMWMVRQLDELAAAAAAAGDGPAPLPLGPELWV